MPHWSILFVLAALLPVSAAPAADSRPVDVKAHYTKYEYRIPMRDGRRLFTAVYVPKDQTRPVPSC